MLPLHDGRLVFAYTCFTGGSADNSTAHIAACFTTGPDRHRFGDDRVLIAREGDENVMSVSLLRLPDATILVFYLVKNSLNDCRLYVRRSADELATLSDRVCVIANPGYYVVNNDRAIRLGSGRLLVPVAQHFDPQRQPAWTPRGRIACFRSDDDGRTWQAPATWVEGPPQSPMGLQEPGVVELKDGRILMWARTDLGRQYEVLSSDGGLTWGKLRPGPIVSPLSSASIKRLPTDDGALLLVYNDHSGRVPFTAGGRTPLCTAISTDEARSWDHLHVLENRPDGCFCYTSIACLGESVILGYCAGDSATGGLNRVKLTRVTTAWLRH